MPSWGNVYREGGDGLLPFPDVLQKGSHVTGGVPWHTPAH
jgi:hypothetical protein